MSKFQQLGMIGGQAIDTNSTTQEHQLGLCCKAVDTASTDYGVGEFIYAKGLAATAVGSVVMYSEDGYATKLAVANDAGSIYLTSTAGSVDDSVVAGDRVHGMIGASAIATPAAGQAEMEINYPRTDNIAD